MQNKLEKGTLYTGESCEEGGEPPPQHSELETLEGWDGEKGMVQISGMAQQRGKGVGWGGVVCWEK